MKIEMGESLFYSWLRHVKDCQIVQNNWKASPEWELHNESSLINLMQKADALFASKYGFSVFKQNHSLLQMLQQTECDALGLSMQNAQNNFFAIDVAFHENGVNYGSREETVSKIISKVIRTAMCLWGYLNCKNAELIFASPKINPAILNDLVPCLDDLNALFNDIEGNFKARLIANEDFYNSVLQPILIVSENVADTSELFMRSYQMYKMFAHDTDISAHSKGKSKRARACETVAFVDESRYSELKIGKLANTVLRRILEEGNLTDIELQNLQKAAYSKSTFDLNYPLLAKKSSNFDSVRYYAHPLRIRGEEYYLCSQWFETAANNDRPYLIRWIEQHT